ncbi:hypothetical protein AMTRI_Chr13g85430 [Amborella trichopoda]
MAGRGKAIGSGGSKKTTSRSSKAGLQIPVGRIARFSKAGNLQRGLVLKSRIVPRHIQLAVRNDEELSRLLGTVTIANGGVLPNIHSTLFPRKYRPMVVQRHLLKSRENGVFFNLGLLLFFLGFSFLLGTCIVHAL